MPLVKALALASTTTVMPIAVAPPIVAPAAVVDDVDPDAATLCGVVRAGNGCSAAIPAFENGRPIGFKMFGVRIRPAAQARGLQDGDVVMRLNGFELTSPEEGLKAYESIKRCADVKLVVKRNGVVVELGPPVLADIAVATGSR